MIFTQNKKNTVRYSFQPKVSKNEVQIPSYCMSNTKQALITKGLRLLLLKGGFKCRFLFFNEG